MQAVVHALERGGRHLERWARTPSSSCVTVGASKRRHESVACFVNDTYIDMIHIVGTGRGPSEAVGAPLEAVGGRRKLLTSPHVLLSIKKRN